MKYPIKSSTPKKTCCPYIFACYNNLTHHSQNFRNGGTVCCDSFNIHLQPATDGFSLLLYPNPATEKVMLRSNANQPIAQGEVLLFDLQAKTVQAPVGYYPDGHFEIDVSNLTAGIYFVRHTHLSGQQQVARLVVE